MKYECPKIVYFNTIYTLKFIKKTFFKNYENPSKFVYDFDICYKSMSINYCRDENIIILIGIIYYSQKYVNEPCMNLFFQQLN